MNVHAPPRKSIIQNWNLNDLDSFDLENQQ